MLFELPSLGADMDEGTLLEWRVRPGDTLRKGQVVAVVDTSKAAVDVEVWHEGVVEALLVEPGTTIQVGAPMMRLGDAKRPAGASVPPTGAAQAAVAARAPASQAAGAAIAAVSTAPGPAVATSPARTADTTGAAERASGTTPHRPPSAGELLAFARHPVSPAARKRGRELDVDVETLEGTGPHGAVTVPDVERAATARAAKGAAAPAAPAAPGAPGGGPTAGAAPAVPASRAAVPPHPPTAAGAFLPADAAARQAAMRASIAAAMTRSKREIPHSYLAETIPMGIALDWLRRRNESVGVAERVLPAALLLKAAAVSIARVPELNGTMRDGRFEPSAAVHAGVAISMRGGGVVAPAIHDVQGKPLATLMRDLADLVRRARAGSLRSSEMSDPTITVTQLGDQGVESVFGVIYPPQVAIVGFGAVVERPWVRDGFVGPMPVVTATLSADHRVSDGHRGALYLAELRERLQRPETLDSPDGG
ncbi:MAG: dihydrolipoamide acetyltransferase family protein [Burkholderiales bacterium]